MKKLQTLFLSVFAFLFPWTFVPFAFEYFESAKYMFLLTILVLSALIFAVNVWVNGKVVFRRSPFDKPLLLWLAVGVLSTVVSIHTATSFYGYYSRLNGSLFGMLMLVGLYFVLVNGDYKLRTVKKAWTAGLVLMAGFFVLQYFGLLNWFWVFMNNSAGASLYSRHFSPVGSNLAVVFMLVSALPLVLPFAYTRFKGKNKIPQTVLALVAVVTLLAAVVIGIMPYGKYYYALVLGIVLLLLGYFYYINMPLKAFNNKVSAGLLIVLILLSAVFLVPQIRGLLTLGKYDPEPLLDLRTSWAVSSKTLFSQGAKSFLLGTGPETFAYDFTIQKPVDYNNNLFWNLRYSSNSIEVLNVLQSLGVLGLAALAFLVFKFARFTIPMFDFPKIKVTEKNRAFVPYKAVIVLSFGLLIITSFYSVNWIIFMMALGLFVKEYYESNKGAAAQADVEFLSSGENKSASRMLPRLFVLKVIVLVFGVGIIASRSYFADIKYRESLNALVGEDLTGALIAIQNGLSLSSDKPYLYRHLALLSVRSANTLLSVEEPTTEQQQRAQSFVNQAVFSIQTASNMNRYDVENSEAAGQIFGNIYALSGGTLYATETLGAIRTSISLDPFNPQNYVNLGLFLYRLKSIDEAEVAFTNAYNLRPDYAVSVLGLGSVLEEENKLDLAKQLYEQTIALPTVGAESSLGQELTRRLGSLGENTLKKLEEQQRAEQELQTNTNLNPDGTTKTPGTSTPTPTITSTSTQNQTGAGEN